MTRIGIDARLLAYRKGGIAEYTRQLIQALAVLDTQNPYTIIHRSADKENYCPGANFSRMNSYTPAHHRFERWAFSFELLPRRLDLLHSPDFIPPLRGARKHIITVHDLHFLHYPEFQTAESLGFYRGQIEWAVRHADHIFAQTQNTRQDIIDMLQVPPEKITVHLLGIHESFRLLAPETIETRLAPYHLPDAYLLFVGTIEPRKNLPRLIQAYQQLKAALPDLPPLLIGGQLGWQADASLAAIRAAGDDVIWFENVPFSVLPALYNRAVALILPSVHEGFGLPAVEAMACGTPVIVSKRGALPEVVGDAGVYIDPEDSENMADAIRQVLQDDTFAQALKVAGLARAKQFSWLKAAEITLQTYQKVLES